jgi:hypothetical protein
MRESIFNQSEGYRDSFSTIIVARIFSEYAIQIDKQNNIKIQVNVFKCYTW